MPRWKHPKESAVAGFSLKIETLRMLRDYAKKRKMSASRVVEEALREYLEKNMENVEKERNVKFQKLGA